MNSSNCCIAAVKEYIDKLNWVIVPVHGPGQHRPKAPLFAGWPVCRPDVDSLVDLLAALPNAGIALNLGASGVVDVEGDTPEGEALLDDLCAGSVFPCYRSARSTHCL